MVLQDVYEKITKYTKLSDLIIDAMTNVSTHFTDETIDKYAPYCNRLEIWYLYGYREAYTHEELNTGRKINIDFVSAQELLEKIFDNKKKRRIARKLEEILNETNSPKLKLLHPSLGLHRYLDI